ncbi:MAG: hypothetical protein NVSMB53_01780 [Gemmatimonadaceae bacterium]
MPCQDFYQFANGGWLKRAKIPPSYPEFGSFQELYDQNEAVLHDILTTSMERVKSRQDAPGTGDWKVGTFYATCMDTAAIESAGSAPHRLALDRIAAINTVDGLKRAFGDLEKRAGLAPWCDGSTQDSRDAANTIAGLYQGGLSLPNSEYYTKTDTASANFRAKFTGIVAHASELLAVLVSSDLHPPAKWRVNGPLSNMPEFEAACGCKEGVPMVRPVTSRPRIW